MHRAIEDDKPAAVSVDLHTNQATTTTDEHEGQNYNIIRRSARCRVRNMNYDGDGTKILMMFSFLSTI